MRDTWRITESLTNTNPSIPLLTNNGRTVTEIQEKVNPFADNSEHIFTTNSDVDRTFTVRAEHAVSDFLKQLLTDWMSATNNSAITWIIRHLNHSKQLVLK
jgi:hypothetical protein